MNADEKPVLTGRKRSGLWLLLVLAFLMFVFFSPTDNWSWDPSFYYAHISSPLIDGDVDFRNNTHTGGRETSYTITGLQNSHYPVGTSIVWSPFFVVAHVLTRVFSPSQANGLSTLYIAFVSTGSILYGLAALYVIYQICLRFATHMISLVTALLCGLATPVFYYIFRQPLMAHTAGLLVTALMVLVYLELTECETLDKQSGVWFGVVLSLCMLTRWYNLLVGIVPFIYFMDHLRKAIVKRSWAHVKKIAIQIAIMLAITLIMVSPQIVLWYRLHLKVLVFPQNTSNFVESFWPLNLGNVFLHSNRGLLFWCPFMLMGLAGTGFIQHKQVRLMAFIYFSFMLYLLGRRVDWYGGGAFGTRYFIETLPFIALGFASAWGKLGAHAKGRWPMAVGCIALVIHQGVLMYSVEHGAEGWIALAQYFSGDALGLRWQLDNFLRLLRTPALYFASRPNIGVEHQSILTNLLAGVRDIHAYAITALATLLVPVFVYLAWVLFNSIKRRQTYYVLTGIVLLFVLWAVIYAVV